LTSQKPFAPPIPIPLDKPVGLEVLFSWDAKAKKYTAKKKRIPTPTPPKGYQVLY